MNADKLKNFTKYFAGAVLIEQAPRQHPRAR